MNMKRPRQIVMICSLLIVFVSMSGCTPEKAKAARNAILQFNNESHIAINTIELTINKEFEPMVRSESEANDEFVENIKEALKKKPISEEKFIFALDPYGVELTETTLKLRDGYINDLRSQYAMLTSIFDGIEEGSFFAKDAVKDTVPIVKKLTAQMAVTAGYWAKSPPKLIQYRSAILARVNKIQHTSDSEEVLRTQILKIKDDWQNVIKTENLLQKEVVEKCLKAATHGIELVKILEQYDKIDIQTIQDTFSIALDRAGQVTGRDYSELKAKSDNILNELKSDPAIATLINDTLSAISTPITGVENGELVLPPIPE